MNYAERDGEGQALVAEFQKGLQKLGWAEGRNIRFDYRWSALDAELTQRFAKLGRRLARSFARCHTDATRERTQAGAAAIRLSWASRRML